MEWIGTRAVKMQATPFYALLPTYIKSSVHPHIKVHYRKIKGSQKESGNFSRNLSLQDNIISLLNKRIYIRDQ